jgi:predicted flap endonuclease-1-like 5' DNA nuclease
MHKTPLICVRLHDLTYFLTNFTQSTSLIVRTVYLIIGFFFVWCLLCAQWYLFWVKGLSPKPENINPHESAWAIVEIMLMVLVSVLIGFALAWLLKQQDVVKHEQEVQNLLTERAAHLASQHALHEQIQKSENILARARETFREDFLTVSRDNERLKAELEESGRAKEVLTGELTKHQHEITLVSAQLDQCKKEFGLLQLAKQKLEHEPVEKTSEAPDDLKVINGIGPGIEKKLNAEGIYTFRQISELTEDSIKKLTDTILFFPGRIERDRWVEQASKLYLDKIRK